MSQATPSNIRASRPQTPAGFLWFLGSATVLSGLVPLGIVAAIPVVANAPWGLPMIILVIAGVGVSARIASGDPSIMQFIVWLFSYLFFGVAPTINLRAGTYPSTTPGVEISLVAPATGIVLLGLLCFEVGAWLGRRRRRKSTGSDKATIVVVRDVATTRLAVLSVAGLALAVYYVYQVGVSTLFESRAALSYARSNTLSTSPLAAIVASLAWIPLLVSAHGWFQLSRAAHIRGNSALKRRARLFGWVSAILVLAVENPIGNARYTAGTAYSSFLGPLGGFVNRTRTRISYLVIFLGLVIVFPNADAFRRSINPVFQTGGLFDGFLGNGDYDAFWTLQNAIAYVQTNGITWGNQLLGAVLFWVPRTWWPAKPVDSGILLANFRGYQFTNLSAPLWAEFIINFGPVGVIAGFLIVGWLCQRIDAAASLAFIRGGHAAVLGAILPFYLTILLRGSLLQAAGSLVVLLISWSFIRGSGEPATEAAAANGLSTKAIDDLHRLHRRRTPPEDSIRS